MVIQSGVRLLFAGCMSAVLFSALPAFAEDNGFGVGNGGGGVAAPVAVPPPASAPAASPAPAPATAGAPAVARAAGGGGGSVTPVIAVVDVDMIVGQSLAARSVAAQRDKWQQTYQSELAKEEASLRETKQKLDEERQSSTPEAFQPKAKAFEQSVGEFERKVLQRRRALEKSYAIAMGQVDRTLLDAIGQVASSRGANLVLQRAQVMMFDEHMNISKEVSEILNRKLAKVDMPTPELEPLDAPPGAAKKK